jgi:hypothetical protein
MHFNQHTQHNETTTAQNLLRGRKFELLSLMHDHASHCTSAFKLLLLYAEQYWLHVAPVPIQQVPRVKQP